MNEKSYQYKIYSRKRWKIFSKNNKKYTKREKTIIYILIIFIIAVISYITINKAFNPIFEEICSDEAKSIATKITNEQSTNVMRQHSYDDMFNIQKDENRKYTNDKCKYFFN